VEGKQVLEVSVRQPEAAESTNQEGTLRADRWCLETRVKKKRKH